MIKRFLSPRGLWQEGGLALIRIVVGSFMIFHGFELFDKEKMDFYIKWLTDLEFPSPPFMAVLGKITELLSGIFLTLGLFTRVAVIPLAITMTVVSFGMGKGRVFMEDQHPFLFVLLAFIFFFTGGGKWSLDHLLFGRKFQ